MRALQIMTVSATMGALAQLVACASPDQIASIAGPARTFKTHQEQHCLKY